MLSIISLKDEAERVEKRKRQVNEKLRRMARAYTDGLFPDEEYSRQKRLLELELESLVIPEANAAEKAGKLLLDLPKLWEEAGLPTEKLVEKLIELAFERWARENKLKRTFF